MSDVLSYLQQKEQVNVNPVKVHHDENYQLFYTLVNEVDQYLIRLKDEAPNKDWNEVQFRALIGDKDGELEYLQIIEDYLEKHKKTYVSFPKWYRSLNEAIFHEIIGLAGVAEWLYLDDSSTCKIIQPNIYFRESESGNMVKKPQSISREQFDRLVTMLCHSNLEKRKNDPVIEILIRGNIRATIYNNVNKAASEGTITFRKYVLQSQSKGGYKFEQLAERGMFGYEACSLLESMVQCRFNVNFIGAPNTGKTTLLSYYSSYEKPDLEGITIQNEAEFDSTVLVPDAPIIDFIINDENRNETKSAILRSDLEYLTYGEVRRGDELDLLLFLSTKGINGVKGTYHTAYNPEDFPYLVADQIQKSMGADLYPTMLNAAKSFDFLFETINHPFQRKSKLLKGVYELCLDPNNLTIYCNAICLYDHEKQKWLYNNNLSYETVRRAKDINFEGYKRFKTILDELTSKNPLPEAECKRVSVYSHLIPKYR